MKISYNWLQEEYFDKKLPSAQEVADALLFHSFEIEGVEKVGDDIVIDIDVLPNRAHDCLSHRGIARELAVILGIPFSEKTIEADFKSVDATLSVDVVQKEQCQRYLGRIIKNIEVRESPEWLKKRIEVSGQRSINALVDATNYVLLDIGQPTHVFDLAKIGSSKIIVRESTGESLETLDNRTVELQETDLIIAGEKGPLAIAGVKGGKKAEVTGKTTDIVLESAHFDPVSVRKTSRRLDIMTDASKRFENEPTPELAAEAMEYLTRLIVQLCSTDTTVVERSVDVYQKEPTPRSVIVDSQHINKILGITLANQEIADIFNRFGWDYQKTGDEFTIQIPEERLDLNNTADIVEEVGRVYGYKNIQSEALPSIDHLLVNKEFYYVTRIKQVLVEAGFSEVYTQSFQTKGVLEMANPVAKDRPYLRESINLSESFELNLTHKDLLGIEEVKIFEIGKVFDRDAGEKLVLSIRTEKAPTENILEAYGIALDSNEIEVDLELLIKKLPEVASYDELEFEEGPALQYKPFSAYPYIVRDIAVWIPENTPREELVEVIIQNAGDLLVQKPRCVDEYTKDGRISYSHRLIFQSFEKTLTDVEVGKYMSTIENAIKTKGWEVR